MVVSVVVQVACNFGTEHVFLYKTSKASVRHLHRLHGYQSKKNGLCDDTLFGTLDHSSFIIALHYAGRRRGRSCTIKYCCPALPIWPTLHTLMHWFGITFGRFKSDARTYFNTSDCRLVCVACDIPICAVFNALRLTSKANSVC